MIETGTPAGFEAQPSQPEDPWSSRPADASASWTPGGGAPWTPGGGGGWTPSSNAPVPSPTTPPNAHPALIALVIAALVLASGGLGVALGVSVPRRAARVAVQPAIPVPDSQSIPNPNDGASPGANPTPAAPATPAAPGAGGTADAVAIAAKIEPGVADINTTITGGQAAGTGMVLTASGLVLTNNHVIDGAQSVTVQIDGKGPDLSAKVLGYDATLDVALLQLAGAPKLQPVPVGDSSTVAMGDPVVAIGNALGKGGAPAVTTGQVSGLDQSITANDGAGKTETLDGMIQINAPIQPGDSGGPLVDRNGLVIGMNTAASGGYRRQSASRVAFSVPINTALRVAKAIEAGQGSDTIHIGARGILGVEVDPSGSGTTNGAPILNVQPGGPAAAAGLSPGDVIVSVGGKTINSVDDLQPALGVYHPGDRVDIGWLDRSGQHHTATVRLGAGPPA